MKSIVFDLDGTLIDCKQRHSLLADSLCRAAGYLINTEKFWLSKRSGASTSLALKLQGLSSESASSISKIWAHQVEQDVWLRMDRVFPLVKTLLRQLSNLDYDIYLLTGRTDERALLRQLHWLLLDRHIHKVISVAHPNVSSKKAMHLSQISPILFIGDSEVDALAAFSANVPFAGVVNGQRSLSFFLNNMYVEVSMLRLNVASVIQSFLHEIPPREA